MHGLVRCKHERRCSRARRTDVSFRDVSIKTLDRGYDQGCEWRHAPEAWAEIWEKSVSWDFASEEEGWLSLARRGLATGAHVVWGRWKSQVYLSPYVEKSFNSKVIKSFVPELRSRKCFCVSGFLCALWTFYVHIRVMGMLQLQMESVTQVKLLEKAAFISLRANPLGKGMKPAVITEARGK